MLVLLDSCCGLSLRNGSYVISFLCFCEERLWPRHGEDPRFLTDGLLQVFGVLNLVAVFVTVEPDSAKGVNRSVHLGISVLYLCASLLLAAAVAWASYRAVLVWLSFYSAVTLLALVGHDLSRFHRIVVDADSVGGIVVGVGIFNIVVDLIFLLVVLSYYRQISFKMVEDARPQRPVTTL